MVLGEGSYSISMIPNGNFTMNAFVYGGNNNRFLGGRKNVRSYTHNFRVGGWSGEKFLIQLVKLQEGCRGCLGYDGAKGSQTAREKATLRLRQLPGARQTNATKTHFGALVNA